MSTPSPESILPTLPKSDSDACQLEQEHVHKVYNEIAHTFSDSRYRPWPCVEKFLRTFSSGSFVLDIGCGNGKYLNLRNDLMMVEKKRSSLFILIELDL
jgi:hypothetical protein